MRGTRSYERLCLCWWISNDRTCPDGDQCNFKHVVADEKEQTLSGACALLPQSNDRAKREWDWCVSSPGPSTRQEHPRGLTRDSWNKAWGKYRYHDKWTDAWNRNHDGDKWAHAWNNHHHHDNWIDTWIEHEAGDKWRSGRWETSGRRSSHWETCGWNKENEFSHNRDESPLVESHFFSDRLLSSLCRGEENVITFTGLEVDSGESLADTAAQSGIIDLRPISKGRRSSLLQVRAQTVCHSQRQPSSGHRRQGQGVGKGGDALRHSLSLSCRSLSLSLSRSPKEFMLGCAIHVGRRNFAGLLVEYCEDAA